MTCGGTWKGPSSAKAICSCGRVAFSKRKYLGNNIIGLKDVLKGMKVNVAE